MDGRPITNSELWDKLVSRNCGRNSEFKHRNRLLILLATIAGFREIELTFVTNRVFVSPEGELNEIIVLPEQISRDGFERPIVLSHPELMSAFEAYFTWLIERKLNCYPHRHYNGLDPNAPLFVNETGLLTTRQISADYPAIALVTGPPTSIMNMLEAVWL